MDPMAAMTGKTMSADVAMMATRQAPPSLPKGNYGEQQARKVAEDFESVFLSQMIQPMFEGTDTEAPFGGGASEKMWKSLQIDEYGKALARSGGIGIADQIYSQLMQAQELGQTPAPQANADAKR